MTSKTSEAGVATPAVAHQLSTTNSGNYTAQQALEWLQSLDDEVEELRTRMDCDACSAPAPPTPRWPGDKWARDTRPPHTCRRWS